MSNFIRLLLTKLSSARKYECPPGQVLTPMYVEFVHAQDASSSFSSSRDALADQLGILTQDLEDTFGSDNVYTGLVTFIDDRNSGSKNVYCYKEDVLLASQNSSEMLSTIRNLENIGNYDNAEGTIKAVNMALRNMNWGQDKPKYQPTLRIMSAATDNPSKLLGSQYTENYNYGTTAPQTDFNSCMDGTSSSNPTYYLPNIWDVIDAAEDIDARLVFITSEASAGVSLSKTKEWWEGLTSEFVDYDIDARYADGSLADLADNLMIEIVESACENPPTIPPEDQTTGGGDEGGGGGDEGGGGGDEGEGGGDEGEGGGDGSGEDEEEGPSVGAAVAGATAGVAVVGAGAAYASGAFTSTPSPPTEVEGVTEQQNVEATEREAFVEIDELDMA